MRYVKSVLLYEPVSILGVEDLVFGVLPVVDGGPFLPAPIVLGDDGQPLLARPLPLFGLILSRA